MWQAAKKNKGSKRNWPDWNSDSLLEGPGFENTSIMLKSKNIVSSKYHHMSSMVKKIRNRRRNELTENRNYRAEKRVLNSLFSLKFPLLIPGSPRNALLVCPLLKEYFCIPPPDNPFFSNIYLSVSSYLALPFGVEWTVYVKVGLSQMKCPLGGISERKGGVKGKLQKELW